MKQPHEIKEDYRKADELIAIGEKKIKGKYSYIDQEGNSKEISYPIVDKNEIEAISDGISEIMGVLKDNHSKAKTEQSKKKNMDKQEMLEKTKNGLRDKYK